MTTKECRHCAKFYEYELSTNLIVFCPHCHRYDYLECEYGYGPVVPCFIYLGEEVIAMVDYGEKESGAYVLSSKKYNLSKVLNHRYLEALQETIDIIAEYLTFE